MDVAVVAASGWLWLLPWQAAKYAEPLSILIILINITRTHTCTHTPTTTNHSLGGRESDSNLDSTMCVGRYVAVSRYVAVAVCLWLTVAVAVVADLWLLLWQAAKYAEPI